MEVIEYASSDSSRENRRRKGGVFKFCQRTNKTVNGMCADSVACLIISLSLFQMHKACAARPVRRACERFESLSSHSRPASPGVAAPFSGQGWG